MKKIHTFYNARTSGDATGVAVHTCREHENGTFQAVITGTAIVLLEGRVSEGFPWVTITSLSSTDIVAVALPPQVRCTIPTYGSGEVSAALAE